VTASFLPLHTKHTYLLGCSKLLRKNLSRGILMTAGWLQPRRLHIFRRLPTPHTVVVFQLEVDKGNFETERVSARIQGITNLDLIFIIQVEGKPQGPVLGHSNVEIRTAEASQTRTGCQVTRIWKSTSTAPPNVKPLISSTARRSWVSWTSKRSWRS
jgi:hypothetical protein